MVIDTSVVTGQFIGGTGTPGTTNMAKATGIAITRGDICNVNTTTTPDSLQTCPISGTTATGTFYWCEQTAPIGTTGVSVRYDGEVTVKCDGTVEPNALLVTSATTAGRVQQAAGTPEAANRQVGIYLRHPGEASGAANPATAAANGDVIVILLRPGVG
ncbi:MAG: hypothetical protein QOK66_01000 [Nitrososphaeraceae archaeon]|nr:hypothetical protein [Nitrososphaeraceae archaeon]